MTEAINSAYEDIQQSAKGPGVEEWKRADKARVSHQDRHSQRNVRVGRAQWVALQVPNLQVLLRPASGQLLFYLLHHGQRGVVGRVSPVQPYEIRHQ
jgi:hypothetical protein